MLERFNLKRCKKIDSPIVEKVNGEADNSELKDERKSYQDITRCLIYLATYTRYNIRFGVMVLSPTMNRVIHNDMTATKRSLRYIKGRPSLGIKFKRGHFILKSYTDTCFATPTLNNKSASGYLMTLGGGIIMCGKRIQ